ncbi:MAG: NlpC/P60 family protein [Cellulosilyticaceae bacterium]
MQLKKTLCTVVMSLSTLLVPTLTFGQAYGKVNVETLNMRNTPATTATNIGQLDQSDEVEIVGRANDEWLEIVTPNGNKAYVFAAFVAIVDAEGIVNGQGVRLRDYPDVNDSTVFETLHKGDKVVIEYAVGDWCKVIAKGKEGFVSKQFLDSAFLDEVPTKTMNEIERVKPAPVVSATKESNKSQSSKPQSNKTQATTQKEVPVKTSNSSLGESIAQDALQFKGGRYVYGGNSLKTGVDCSGFTQQIMKRHGVSISRSSRSQYANDGYKVSKDSLQKGDLLFYGYNGAVSHVALYIGNGQVIHANTSSTGIIISPAFSAGKPYIGAKRVI